MKNIAIGFLLVALAFTSYRIIEIENQRYALIVGMCRQIDSNVPDLNCLQRAQSRTNWLWHLYYGLTE